MAVSRHRELLALTNAKPTVNEGCFVAPTAGLSGEVTLGKGSSVWYGAIVKGDRSKVSIGSNTTIREGAVVQGGAGAVSIGNNVTIGQGAVVGAATIGDNASIGMKAAIGDGAVIEDGAAVADGAHVTPDTKVPAGSLFSGKPAIFVRKLSEAEVAAMAKAATIVCQMAPTHAAECNKVICICTSNLHQICTSPLGNSRLPGAGGYNPYSFVRQRERESVLSGDSILACTIARVATVGSDE